MSLHLAEISSQVARGAHAVVIMDGAGWHQTGGKLRMPANITPLRLPPYAPELNPVENVWAYLRSNKLANRNCQVVGLWPERGGRARMAG